ncbi:hypothetical protein SNE40_020427 [Patella caerulea]|uniref:Transcription elongation factor, mitochondrial n=1 Tax=Patella caerulea TaxID=87958 RepID=A0AAN8GE17_PATCE
MELLQRSSKLFGYLRISINTSYPLKHVRCRRYSIKRGESLNSKYNEEQRQKILQHLNQSTADELFVPRVMLMQRAVAIQQYRSTNGQFNSISDVLNISGIGPLVLEKFCDFIIKSPETLAQEKNDIGIKKFRNSLFNPKLSSEDLKKINNVIAIDLQLDRITWAKMDRDLVLQDWSHALIYHSGYQKFNHAAVLEKLQEITQTMSDADIFVMENKLFRITNLKVVPLALNFRVLEAMLLTVLSMSFNRNVVTSKPNEIGNYYGLIIGGERVSGINLLKDLFQNRSEHLNCQISNEFRTSYYKAENVQQEYYTNCLLLANAYHKLVLREAE